MSLDVEINSKQYSLVPGGDGTKISTRPVQQFVQPIRDTGRTRPEDVAAYESFVVPNLAYGFGRARINSDVAFDPKEYRRFFNSTCDTRWMDRIYLPILSENSTQTGINVVKCSTSFKGEINSLWSTTAGDAATSRGVANKQFTGASTDAWENGGYLQGGPGVQNLGAGADLITYNKAMTVSEGTDLLIVVVSYTDNAISYALTNVGYNAASNGSSATSMTELYNAIDTTNDVGIGIFYVVNPTIADDKYFTARMDSGTAVSEINAVAYTVRGADTAAISAATANSADTSGTAISTSLTTAVNDIVIDVFAGSENIAASSSGSDQTSGMAATGASIAHSHKSTYKNATTTSTTMSHTLASSIGGGFLHAVGAFAMLPQVPVDIISDSGNLVALTIMADDHRTYTSSSGSSWTESTTPVTKGMHSENVSADFGTTEPVDAGLFATIGGELVLAIHHGSNITFFTSTNGGVAWTDESVDIPSANGPQGMAVYPDIDGEDKLYVGTSEGIYIVDTSPSTWTYQLIMPMPDSTHNGRRMTIHEGSLWFAQGVDNDSPAPIYKLTVQGNSRIIESGFGLSYGDGVPSDMLGPVRWMVSSGDQLFISIGGQEGSEDRNARILAWNGNGWHHMYKNPAENNAIDWIDIGSGDDGVPRLHYSMRTAVSTCDAEFLEQPLVNPRSGVSIKRADLSGTDSGHIELPYYDLGIPQESKNFTAVHVSADDLTDTSNEYIEVEYGIDGAVTTTDLGNYTSSTTKNIFASGAGISAKNIGLRLKFNRGSTNTYTPKMRDLVIEGLVVPTILYEHQMTIDIEQTAEETGQSVETVISNIETLVESVIQTQAKFGQVSKYVTLDRERSAFSFQLNSWDASGAPNSMAERTGTFNCVLVEKVAE